MPQHEDIVAAGPLGALGGTLTIPAEEGPLADEVPVLLIVPGSGPTDRDGNSPLGISAAPYRLLAEALAERGYPSVRIDKRGMFGSAGAITDPNDVTISAYGDDLVSWTRAIRMRLPSQEGVRCVVPLGHSEGGLIALASLPRLPDACGLILISSLGRPFDAVLRAQLHANPANAAVLDEADRAIAQLKQGARVDAGALSPALQPIFSTEVQGFLIDAFSYDPVALAAEVEVPMLVIQGMRDLQVGEADARALASAAPEATLALLPEVNHVLKVVDSDDRSANLATYSDPALPIASSVVDAVTQYLERAPRRAPAERP
ncbi:hydrolase [Roseivivax isoporae LMG 25204]|uniref:Hydrolase n=1 Tax=Roseivivax isoporae LMG 25204 TaxID=1449351 RepID=X7F4F3_9RHOB|nr:hydrolase [Roseivivax isoporae LMG 25204]